MFRQGDSFVDSEPVALGGGEVSTKEGGGKESWGGFFFENQ